MTTIQGAGGGGSNRNSRNRTRDFSGIPADRQSMFEQRFSDLDRRAQDIDAQRALDRETYDRGMLATQQAQETAMQGARTSALMPVYSMQAQTGLAGVYSGGQNQAASQASMLGQTRAAQLGSSFADRLVQMEQQQAEREAARDREMSDVAAAKTELEGQVLDDIDQNIQTDMEGLRKQNYMDVDYFTALMRRAENTSGRAREAYLAAARDIYQSDTLTQYMYDSDEMRRAMGVG
tara:strand:- start:767 stop:1471 length:705 start_codon:yes stop_codon:yes gene_type:complete